MDGQMLYEPPGGHSCKVPTYTRPGSVWRCDCGQHWRMHSIGLMNAPGWYPMGRLETWWFLRRKARS